MDPVLSLLMQAAAGAQSGPLSYIGQTGASSASGTSITVVPHANAQPGDLLVAQLGSNSNSHFTDKAGWERYMRLSGNFYGSHAVWSHTMQPEDAGGITFIHPESTAKLAMIHVFRNARLEQAGHNQYGSRTGSGSFTIPGLEGASGGYVLRTAFCANGAAYFTIGGVTNVRIGDNLVLGHFVNPIDPGALAAATCEVTKAGGAGKGSSGFAVLIAKG